MTSYACIAATCLNLSRYKHNHRTTDSVRSYRDSWGCILRIATGSALCRCSNGAAAADVVQIPRGMEGSPRPRRILRLCWLATEILKIFHSRGLLLAALYKRVRRDAAAGITGARSLSRPLPHLYRSPRLKDLVCVEGLHIDLSSSITQATEALKPLSEAQLALCRLECSSAAFTRTPRCHAGRARTRTRWRKPASNFFLPTGKLDLDAWDKTEDYFGVIREPGTF